MASAPPVAQPVDAASNVPVAVTDAAAAEAVDASSRYVFKVQGKAWQVVSELRSQLLASGCWTAAARDDQTPHLLLADRGRVNFARDLVGRRAPPVPPQFAHLVDPRQAELCVVNVYRGCNELTNKSALVRTMRQYAAERGLSPEQLEYLPQTFVLRPGSGAAQGGDERAQFLREFAAIQARADGEKNVWIVKANRGAKGDSIFVSDDAEKLIAYVDSRATSVVAEAEAGAGAASPAAESASAVVAPAPASAVAPAASAAAAAAAAGVMDVPAGNGNSSSVAFRAPPLRSRSRLASGTTSASASGSTSTISGRHARTMSLAAAASNSWVVQRYISRPFLLSRRRKFDIRCWVLVDSAFRVYLYRAGVCRTSSASFSLEDLGDRYVHLTNHCIQEGHPDYSANEEGNEVFFPALQEYLDSLPLGTASGSEGEGQGQGEGTDGSPRRLHRLCVICHLLPQIRLVVRSTLGAVRPRLECPGGYGSFQLFGLDLMLTREFRARLLEINATPASAAKLLGKLVAHLRERAIDSVFPSNDSAAGACAAAAPDASASPASDASPSFSNILSRPCHCATSLGGMSKAEYLDPADPTVNLFDLVSL